MAAKTIAIDTESGHRTCADAVRQAAAVWAKSEDSKAEAEKFESTVMANRKSVQWDVEKP